MSETVIKVENLSKVYRVGEWGTGTISHDLNRWWKTSILRQDDPYSKIGQTNDRTQKAQKGEYVWALKDINFEVKQGEVLGIIGKNGAGKSTLLKVLSRITAPTTGEALIKGRVASLLEVGTGFHPEMTGRENIYLNGTIMGMNRKEVTKKLEEIVEFAGVAKYLDTPVKRYSSGMKVRLGFAVAAHLEPEILIVDEVLAVGDAEFQKKAIGKMQDVSTSDGRTVLFVSHNMDSVRKVCLNGIILEDGYVTYESAAKEAVEKYMDIERADINKEWHNKNGDDIDDFIPTSISIEGSKSTIINLVEKFTTNPILNLTFKLNKKIQDLTIGYSLFDRKENLLYRSLTTDFDENFSDKLEIGHNTIKTELPINVLNKGHYFIALDVSIFRKKILFNPNNKPIGIHLEVEDPFNRSKYWDIKRDGILAPSIKWEIKENND